MMAHEVLVPAKIDVRAGVQWEQADLAKFILGDI